MKDIEDQLRDFDDIFEDFYYSKKFENSIKEISNWFLGISLGLFTILLLKIEISDSPDYLSIKPYYKILLIFVFIGIGFSGFCKYRFLKRDFKMNYWRSLMKKDNIFIKLYLKELKEKKLKEETSFNENQTEELKLKLEEYEKNYKNYYNKFIKVFNEISFLHKLVNFIIIYTFIELLLLSIFLITII